jgi:hypothetical protein
MSEEQNAPQPKEQPDYLMQNVTPENLVALGMVLSEFGENLLANLELIARVSLAKAFIAEKTGVQGRYFDAQGYERAWAYLQGDTYETPPQ